MAEAWGDMTGVQSRVTALCLHLVNGELSRLLNDAGAGTTLERLLAAVRAGDPSKVSVADLDALEDAAAVLGIDGLTIAVRSTDERGLAVRLPGMDGSGANFAWICPNRICCRVELDLFDTPPICAISGRPLDRMAQRL
jgi:hypothetical protein